MQSLLLIAFVPLMLVAAPWCVRRPLRTILPVYAATLPVGSVISLSLPLPPPFNTVSSMLGGLTMAACILHVAVHRRGRAPTIPVAMWLFFLAWAALSTFWAVDPGAAYEKLLVATPLVVLLLMIALVPADDADLDALRLGIIVSGVVVGLYALYLFLTGGALPAHGTAGERFSLATEAGETNPNILAASLLLPLVLSTERLLLGGQRWLRARSWRLLGAAGVILIFVALLLTGSRGGLIAAVAAFLLMLYTARRIPEARPAIRRTTVGILLLVVVGFAIPPLLQAFGLRPPELLNSYAIRRIVSPKAGTSGRAEIWIAGSFACKAHCAVGSGLGNFAGVFDEGYAFSSAGRNLERGKVAHNVYLGMAVEGGTVALTLFILALVAEWRAVAAPTVVGIAPGLRPALVGVLLGNVFLSAIWFKYFWLVFAVNRLAEGAVRPPARESLAAPAAGSFR